MNRTIIPIFPILIYHINLRDFLKNNEELIKIATKLYRKYKHKTKADFACNTFTTFNLINFNEYKEFIPMLNRIIQEVSVFANEFGVDYTEISCTNSWLNLAKPGAFQEMHVHPDSHFSSVYYAQVSENSGSILFQSHEGIIDMYPLPINKNTFANTKRHEFKPKECDLLIFRSNLMHMVNLNNSNIDRISISSNFTLHGSSNSRAA